MTSKTAIDTPSGAATPKADAPPASNDSAPKAVTSADAAPAGKSSPAAAESASRPAPGADPTTPAGSFRVLGCVPSRSGSIEVRLLVARDLAVSISVLDRFGTLHERPAAATPAVNAQSVNLVAATDAEPSWHLSPQDSGAVLAQSLSDKWRLRADATFSLSSGTESETDEAPRRVTLADPVTGGDCPVEPMTRYAFGLLVATHRCSAKITVTIKDAAGVVLGQNEQLADRQFRGGAAEADYQPLTIDFVTPDGAAACEISVEKGRTEMREDSKVFFARPSLTRVLPGARPAKATTLSLDMLKAMKQSADAGLRSIVVAVPDELFVGDHARCGVVIATDQDQQTIADIDVTREGPLRAVRLRIEHGAAHVTARSTGGEPVPVDLAIYVDDDLSVRRVIDLGFDGDVDTHIRLDRRHLDGRGHRIEARLMPQGQVIGTTFEILPAVATPWSALQAYAGPNLGIMNSPAAGHHLRSLRLWMKHRDDARPIPPLDALHDELIRGFEKRESYPPLAFPVVDDPDVSIVIPVHNKFEVTYFCLCALLFAYNDTSFEVIVTDDGSSDATTDIEDIVSGITVVRHASAQGFVASCNDGAAKARGKYVAFLNNDTEPTARWLDELVDTFGDFDKVGLVGSKLLYPDGKLQEAGGIVWRSGNPWNVGRNGNAADPQFSYLRQVDYLSGAAILLTRALWEKLDGFSRELAPAYFEDTDLAMKVRDSGHAVVFVPNSIVYHFEGQSAGTSTASGMKRFQEVNRPKFKRKWSHLYGSHGVEGVRPDQEKDRHIGLRVLFIDHRYPFVDGDAGSYAAFQEIRLIQALGAKVTFLPRNLAWMDRHTVALERIGVECLYAPFVMDFTDYLRDHAKDYDAVYVNRYSIAEQVTAVVRGAAPQAKILLNLADLHFLREMREAAAGTEGYSFEAAGETRERELAMVMAADLTLSYTDVEIAVLTSHLAGRGKVARLPWVVDTSAATERSFAKTKDILFLGGFGHPPNAEAVKFFVREVMPQLRKRLPGVVFNVVGSKPPPDILALATDDVNIAGFAADLAPWFSAARVYVAPLQAGAGIKGKVLEGMARGQTMVLSPVAAEGTGLVDGVDCLIARDAGEWVEAIVKAASDEEAWADMGRNAVRAAQRRFGFETGVELMRDAFSQVELYVSPRNALPYRHAWPRYER